MSTFIHAIIDLFSGPERPANASQARSHRKDDGITAALKYQRAIENQIKRNQP